MTEMSIHEIRQQLDEQIDFDKLNELCTHLKNDIKGILDSCGLYYRIFARIKSKNSISKKLFYGKYNTSDNPKKMQDMIGLRIVLYYSDDLSIGREIMDKTFQRIGDWSKNDFNAAEFRATKINGVFRFPSEYFNRYTKEPWNLPIDTTFEMQFRTVFFEGWHEIEHDMRYKSLLPDDKFWENSEELSRILNCILANLELSDWSLVQLFEQLSYNHYQNKNWELMFKSHFRLRMNDRENLSPYIKTLFDNDHYLAKSFFKCKRITLIRELLKQDYVSQINFNLIVKLLNDSTVHNAEIEKYFQEHDPLAPPLPSASKKPLSCLEGRTLFQLEVPLLHKATRNIKSEFNNSARIVYRWARYKLNLVFPEIPSEISDIEYHQPGYDIKFCRQPDKLSFQLELSYIDDTMPGTLWHINASVSPCDTNAQQLLFQHRTTLYTPSSGVQREAFFKPTYLSELAAKVGLTDQERLGSQERFIDTPEALHTFEALLHNPQRRLPIVLITQYPGSYSSASADYRKGYDMNTFPVNGTRLAKVIGLYAHVCLLDHSLSEQWSASRKLSSEDSNGSIMIFWPPASQKEPTLYTQTNIQDAHFDFNRFAYHEKNFIEKAFRSKLAQIIKDDNVSH